jgi:hypothetical protein
MKTNQILKWLPSSFILIGIGLWMNSLCFSPITNSYEIDLKKDWTAQLEQGSSVIDSTNGRIYLAVKSAVLKRPDDEIILNTISQILALKDKTFKLLDEHLKRSDTNTAPIITAFEKENQAILYDIMKKNPMISEEEIESVLSQQSLKKVDWLNDAALFINTQKQQVNSITAADLVFLSKKTGGMVIHCFPMINPTIKFKSNVLKKREITKSKVFLSDVLSVYNSTAYNFKYTINGKEIPIIDGIATFKKTFNNNNPQTIEAKYEYETQYFNRRNLIIDTVIINEKFTIYPIQN